MKLLFDQNLSFRLVSEMLDIFPGCGQVARLGLANADDATIWQHARTNGYRIVPSRWCCFSENNLVKAIESVARRPKK